MKIYPNSQLPLQVEGNSKILARQENIKQNQYLHSLSLNNVRGIA